VPESESEQHEAQVNLTEVAEDPNQSSEEPKANFVQEGKPRSITLFLKLCNVVILFTCAFKFIGVGWNLSCMILVPMLSTLVCLGR
jgi:hypothetical protein